MDNEARIDKWLWAARIFKTRSIASDACKNGRVTIGGMNVKPSRPVKVGEVVDVKKPPVTYSFRVLKCIEQRVGAKLLPEVYENVTDPHQRIRRPCPRHGAPHEEGPPPDGRLRRTNHLWFRRRGRSVAGHSGFTGYS